MSVNQQETTATAEKQWQIMARRSWDPRRWFEESDSPLRRDQGLLAVSEVRAVWVYRRIFKPVHNQDVFEVGYFKPGDDFVKEGEFLDADEAARRVHYLNGGRGNEWQARRNGECYRASSS
jgi:hypothetical protein